MDIKVLKQAFQKLVWESLFVGEVHVLKDALEPGVRIFNGTKGDVELGADIDRDFADVAPLAVFRDMKAVFIGYSEYPTLNPAVASIRVPPQWQYCQKPKMWMWK